MGTKEMIYILIKKFRVLIWLKGERPRLGQQMSLLTEAHRRSTKVELLKSRFWPEIDIYMRYTKEQRTKIETKYRERKRIITKMCPMNVAYLGDGIPPRGDLRLCFRLGEMLLSRETAGPKLQGQLQSKEK